MNGINRQTFLAELGKLLTFMYEEDRQAALALYNRLFDECADEQALIQMLASPTRQAVIVARAYNRNERKLQVDSHDDHNMEQAENIPGFILAIEHLFYDAEDRGIIGSTTSHEEEETPAVDENQITFFDMNEPEETASPAVSEPEQAAVPAEPAAEPEVEMAAFEVAVTEDYHAAAEAVEEMIAEEPEETAAPVEEIPAAPVIEQDDIDLFIQNFSIADEKAAEEILPAEEKTEPEYVLEIEDAPEMTKKRVKKVMVGWLILFVIIAVPVGISIIALLTVPALLSLVAAASLSAVGIMALSAVFSAGFVVIADILAIVGVGVIALAFGLLFLWLFVWFIGGAMVGAVRGIVTLGRSWCCKEVLADE